MSVITIGISENSAKEIDEYSRVRRSLLTAVEAQRSEEV